jgi:CHAT domain-containing protein
MPEAFIFNNHLLAGVYGGIEYSTDTTSQIIWNYLPGTKAEADNVNRLLNSQNIKTNYLSGTKAGEKEFKERSSGFDIIHIATHGFSFPAPDKEIKEKKIEVSTTDFVFRGGSSGFGVWQFVKNKNPMMRSGLVLAGANNVWNQKYASNEEDGVLTAQEISQLNLQRTQLVVLSACESGLGDIKGSEGVYGLQRAFKIAGAKFIIMSLWQVPDKETVEFMETFYTKLLKIKEIKMAFSETQKEMRQKYDPYFWAAFVLIE